MERPSFRDPRRACEAWGEGGSLYDLVQPGDGAAVTGVAVDLEVGVPRRAEQLVHPVPERLDGRGGGREVTELLLGDDEVAVGTGGRAVHAVTGHVGHALAVVAVACF